VLDLSPVKILVVLIVALLVLGPDKLPQLARQLGAAWGDFRRWRTRVESDVRGNFPDLPSTNSITDAVRSPLSFLDRLADEHEQERERERQREFAEQERAEAEGTGSSTEPTGAAAEPTHGTAAEPTHGTAAEPTHGTAAEPTHSPAAEPPDGPASEPTPGTAVEPTQGVVARPDLRSAPTAASLPAPPDDPSMN
jgi:TatA/E family protein of Tat protein translocase